MQHPIKHFDDPALVREWLKGYFAALESINEKVNHQYSFSFRHLPGTNAREDYEAELREHWEKMGHDCPITFRYDECKTQESTSNALNNQVFRYVDDPSGEHFSDHHSRFVLSKSEQYQNYRKMFLKNLTEAIITVALPEKTTEVKVEAERPYTRFDGHRLLLSSKHGNNLLTLGEYF